MGYSTIFNGFFASFYVILLSEIGDRTFFVAALLAASNPRILVYIGAMSAMITMTILSSLLGIGFNFIQRTTTLYISAFLFIVFGIKMFKDGYYMSDNNAKEEYEEAKESLITDIDLETGVTDKSPRTKVLKSYFSKYCHPVVIEAFTLCFLLEWGDKSQIATIILTSSYSISGVIIGAIIGHAICTGFAVLAGRFVSYRIPVRWMTMLGGLTFLIFAVHAIYEALMTDQEQLIENIKERYTIDPNKTNTLKL